MGLLTQLFLFSVTVRGNPSITPLNTSLVEGEPLELVCQTTGAWPSPTVAWLVSLTPLSNSTQFTIITRVNQTESGLFQATSRLLFRATIPSQSGDYVCRTDQSLLGRPISSLSPPATVLITSKMLFLNFLFSPLFLILILVFDDCQNDDGTSRCLNGGMCVDGEGDYFCRCVGDFIGRNCEINCKHTNLRFLCRLAS